MAEKVFAKDPEEKLTPEELAKEWKCSIRFLDEARKKLGLPYHPLSPSGRMIRFKRGEIERWLEQRKKVL